MNLTQSPIRGVESILPTTTDGVHTVDLPYRLCSEALATPENTAVWTYPTGTIRAWAVFQHAFWTVDTGGDIALLPTILDWIDQRVPALERPCWFIEALDTDTEKLGLLASAGFHSQSEVPENPWFKVRLACSLPALNIAAPPGYTIRSLRGPDEIAAYVALHRHVFQSENMTTAWRTATLKHSAYRAELDLIVETEDGELVGFCIGWILGNCGHLEPMGVHENHRRRGLGAALISELLRRMERLGATQCLVDTDGGSNPALSLYESNGFRQTHHIHLCRKDF